MLLYSGLKPPGTITDPASFSRGQNSAEAPAPAVQVPAVKKTNAELAQEKVPWRTVLFFVFVAVLSHMRCSLHL